MPAEVGAVAPYRSRSASRSLTLAFGVIVLVGSLQVGIDWGVEGPRPGFFPFYISLFIIVASIINLVQVDAARRHQARACSRAGSSSGA